MTTTTGAGRRKSVTLHNLIPLFWPLWLWGATPGAIVAAAGTLAAGYAWNLFVMAGLLVLFGHTDRVGQKGLLLGALWMTAGGVLADGVHAYALAGLLARLDFLLVADPLATFLAALLLPAAVILAAGLVLSLLWWRLPAADSVLISTGLCAMTLPWLSLAASDTGAHVLRSQALSAFLAALALLAVTPWLLLAAGTWARAHARPEFRAYLGAALAVAVALASLGVAALVWARPDAAPHLAGKLSLSIHDRVYVQDGATGRRDLLASDAGEPVAWSPNGQRVLLQRTISTTHWLQVLDVRDGTVTRLAQGRARAGAWSPDGNAVLFSTERAAPLDGLIWRARLGGIAEKIGEGNGPSWSPDGSRVLYSARGAGNRPQLWVMKPDGSDPIQITADGGEDPAWSPDGLNIAYSYNGRVYLMPAAGGARRQITTGDELFEQNPVLRWSPDATRLAYAVFQPAQGPRLSAIYVVELGGGARLRFSGDYEPPLTWSPDGEWLAVVRRQEVWGIRLETQEWEALAPGIAFAWGAAGSAAPPVTIRPAPTYAPTPTPTPLPPAVVESPDVLAINPKDTTLVYAGTPQGVVRRTATGGWASASQGINQPRRVRAIAVDPVNPAILYAGTDGERSQVGGAVYKSTDGGLRWVLTPLQEVDVYAIAIDPLNTAVVYAGTLRGVFKSTDSGASWRSASSGLKSAAVQALALDPSGAGSGRTAGTQVLYAGTRQGDLHKSVDGGATWSAMESRDAAFTAIAVNPQKPATVLASAADGLLRSIDGGAHWTQVSGGIWRLKLDGVVVDPRTPQTVYVVGPSGIYKSADGGDNWGPASLGLSGTQPTCLVVDPKDAAILYAGTDKGVFRSGNSGVSWDR